MLADVTVYETNTMEFRLIIFNPILFIVISALSFSMNKKHNTWQTSPGGPDGAWRDNNLLRKNNCWEHLILLKSPLFNLLRNKANYRFKKNVHKDGAKMIHHLVDKEIDLHEGEVLLSQNDPHICQTTFCARTSEIKKKFLPITIFLTFSFRILLHLVRRFQKGTS